MLLIIVLMYLFFIAGLSFFLRKILYVISVKGSFWGTVWILIPYGFFLAWVGHELHMGEVTFLITFLSSFIVLYSWMKQFKMEKKMLETTGYNAHRARYITRFNFRLLRVYICGLFLYICSFVGGFLCISSA
ncbi:hypothetical protein C0W42_19850 [Photobacterium kishitanii]|nr:hypothetical protein C0W42_19850 [Photobacterium kishitanii]